MRTVTAADGTTSVVVASSTDRIDPLAEALEATGDVSIRPVSSISEVTDAIESHACDGVVTEYHLEDGTAIDLLDSIGENAAVPVVVCTADGNERIASDAIGAGAADYVPLTDAPARSPAAAERVLASVRDAERDSRTRDRARQFDAVFQNTQSATWVLDGTGELERANETARVLIESDEGGGEKIDDLVGESFWDLPWWANAERTRSDVEEFVTGVIDRRSTARIVTAVGRDDPQMIELTALPVHDSTGELVGVIVEGNDITERVSLYRELRSSEELHRVTLNNMTDTVLVTNDEGAFTYICPNVHFIFGYTVDEIREMGTIDRLLGKDLYDPDELAAAGVLTNIECETTDNTGETHTLLVNVREVDIQGGTVLFSCRDVTKRKQREDALATLQRTSRNLLYAESEGEIAQVLVDDSAEILGLPANAIYLFDTESNELGPSAYTDQFEALHGPLSSVRAGSGTLVGSSFIENEPQFFDDVRTVDRARDENAATDLRSGGYIPLGDHGVLVAGSDAPDQFDTIRREIADLLAATAEAALDRVSRESQLRVQDRQLQRQNERLTQLNDVNELIRDIDRALMQAETRDEVDRTVCEVLTNSTHFSFAWIGERDGNTDDLDPSAWAGAERGYLDAVDLTLDPPGSEPACRTAVTRAATVVDNVAEELRQDSWQKEAVTRGHQSVISVPLVYDDFMYGVLSVYADSPAGFDEMTREIIVELGEIVASAISGLNRKNALLTSTGTRIKFETSDPGFVLVQLAREAACSLSFQGGVKQTATGSAIFVSASGASLDDVVTAAEEMVAIDAIRVLDEGEVDGLVQLDLSRPFIAQSLADHGAVLRQIEANSSVAELIVDVPRTVDTRPIIQHVTDSIADTELVAKYTEDRMPTRELYTTFLERVTDRQLEVVQAAYYSGFFETPRENTGEEVAETLGISPPAFYKHIRAVQRKLFATLFDDIGVQTAKLP